MSTSYTFKELRDEVLRTLDEAGDTSTTKALVSTYINQAHQYRCFQLANQLLVWPYRATLTTEVGRQEYALHEEFMRPLYFYNVDAKRYMKEVPDRQLGPEDYRWNTTLGSAENFVLWGRYPVERQPTSASVLEIVSDNAADSGSDYALFIRGEDSNGRMQSITINPNGVTPVATTTSFAKILQVSKSRQWNGTMTMTSNDGVVTNLVLNYCDMGKSYQYLFLIEGPTTAETLEYRFYRNPQRLVNDYDQPDIPYPFSQILVWDTLILMAGYNTEINRTAVESWLKTQKEFEAALIANFTEGQSLQARVRFVRTYDEPNSTNWITY